MHAFDLDKLNDEIVVRRGRAGEKLVLLDESEVDLDENVLAICDSKGPVAIAGIMGGLDSGVTAETQRHPVRKRLLQPGHHHGQGP